VASRCTIQKQNLRRSPRRGLRRERWVFIDIVPGRRRNFAAFNRQPLAHQRQSEVSLSAEDIERMDEVIEALPWKISECINVPTHSLVRLTYR